MFRLNLGLASLTTANSGRKFSKLNFRDKTIRCPQKILLSKKSPKFDNQTFGKISFDLLCQQPILSIDDKNVAFDLAK